ncbi:APC family permease [Aliibacillus thermotolerans]|uniref:APC family permease n=1 Tax=Aliibacillus thermotolerans TaxID=1834418 RepID=A0ABW0U3G4_9BACI|nr:APC family permease [Aliibacillus thermotolerans]MDA3128819.1 amino acid permease [Aliibacillus thermotolerans]
MHSQKLKKVLSKTDTLMLAFGAMIGWGWVVLSGGWVLDAGVFGAMLAFLIGGILVIFVGLTYSELAAAMPKAGGELVYALRGIGSKSAFVTAWAIALGYISVVAFEAVALPNVLEYIFPDYKVGYIYTVTEYEVYLSWVAVGALASIFVTVVNYIGIKFAASVQMILTMLIILVGIMLVVGTGFNGSFANADPLWTGGAAGLLAVVIATPFMFVGFDVIPQAAEELNIKQKTIGKVLIVSVIVAVMFYIGVIYAVGFGLDQAAKETAELTTAAAMASVFGSEIFGTVLVIGGIGGIMTSWNAFIIGGSRVLFAMAKANMLPSWFGKIHSKYQTPSNAILFIGILSTISPFFGAPMLGWLVDAGGLTIVIAYFMVTVSFILLRKKEPDMPRPFRAGKSNTIAWIAFCLSIFFIIQYLPGMPAGLGWHEWIILLGWWVIGFYFMFSRYRKYKDISYKELDAA